MSELDRRRFLARGTQAAALTSLFSLHGCRTERSQSPPPPSLGKALDAEEWATMRAVQRQLFPAHDDVPGADELKITAYLDAWMAHPDIAPSTRRSFHHGLAALTRLCKKNFGGRRFEALSSSDREQALRAFDKTDDGDTFLHNTLRYTLEALLSDPVHGSNVDERGWKWLGHHAGFPRPDNAEPPRPRPRLRKVTP